MARHKRHFKRIFTSLRVKEKGRQGVPSSANFSIFIHSFNYCAHESSYVASFFYKRYIEREEKDDANEIYALK